MFDTVSFLKEKGILLAIVIAAALAAQMLCIKCFGRETWYLLSIICAPVIFDIYIDYSWKSEPQGIDTAACLIFIAASALLMCMAAWIIMRISYDWTYMQIGRDVMQSITDSRIYVEVFSETRTGILVCYCISCILMLIKWMLVKCFSLIYSNAIEILLLIALSVGILILYLNGCI